MDIINAKPLTHNPRMRTTYAENFQVTSSDETKTTRTLKPGEERLVTEFQAVNW